MSERQDDLRDLSLAELTRTLGQDAATLIRQEVELAKAELSEKASHAAKGAGMFGAAAVAGLAALGAFTAFVVLALALALPAWAAALVTFGIFAAIGGGLALLGRTKVQEAVPPVPEQTIETVREDIEWAKHPTANGARDGDRPPVGSAGRSSS